MTTREEFEAWAEPEEFLLGRVISDERYESMKTEWAYRAWQASRAAALEEAAKECEKLAADAWGLTEEHFAYTDAAEKVRALKDAP